MYLDEVKGDFAGAKVKFIVEDTQAKPTTAVLKAEKLIREDKVQLLVGGLLASDRLRIGAGEHARKGGLYRFAALRRRSDTAPAQGLPLFHPHRMDRARRRHNRSANGPAIKATRRSSASRPTMPSATSRSAASKRFSRTAAARSSRRSGRRSAPRISGLTSRPSRVTPTRCSR